MLLSCDIKYNANGLLTSVRRYEVDADDVATSIANSIYEYNANNAVTSITHNNSSGTEIVKHSYTYDSTNNIVEYLNSLDGSTSYDYDFLGQLISADYANAGISDESYSYDSNGNRLTANGDEYTTGTNNELTSDGVWSYTYDDEGNRISKQNSTNRELYTWDYRNRLTSVTQQTYNAETETWTTTQIIEYTYDYNNVWIRKILDSNGDSTADSKTIFIPENYQTTVQLDDTNLTDANGPAITHHYLWTPNQQDKLLADVTADNVLWTLTDHLGSIRDVVGNSTTHLIYDAFGNLISGTTPILFAYTGKAFDTSTSLQNNINRWYDSTVGRWLSTDPIGFEGNDTNLYRYVENSCIQNLDIRGYYICSYGSIWEHNRDKNWDEKLYYKAEISATIKLSAIMEAKGVIALKSFDGISDKQLEEAYKKYLPKEYSFRQFMDNLTPDWREEEAYTVTLNSATQFLEKLSIEREWKKNIRYTYYYNVTLGKRDGRNTITAIRPANSNNPALAASIVVTIDAQTKVNANVVDVSLYHRHCAKS